MSTLYPMSNAMRRLLGLPEVPVIQTPPIPDTSSLSSMKSERALRLEDTKPGATNNGSSAFDTNNSTPQSNQRSMLNVNGSLPNGIDIFPVAEIEPAPVPEPKKAKPVKKVKSTSVQHDNSNKHKPSTPSPMTSTQSFSVKAAGVTHDGRQSVLAQLKLEQQLKLVREPQNRYDKNAVGIYTLDGKSVGYVPKAIAAIIAIKIDTGSTTSTAKVVQLTGGVPGYPTRGVQVSKLASM